MVLAAPEHRTIKAVGIVATLAVSVLNKRPRPFGQDMASFNADGRDMATFATEDGSVNIEPANQDDVPGTALVAQTRQGEAPVLGRRAAPVGADGSMLAGGLARPLERQPLQTEEDRLRAEVLQLRAEAAASRGLIEERSRRASIYSTAGGRGTRGVSWIEAERNVHASVYKEATLNAEVGVDQSLERSDEDVADRFRRRLTADMNQVERRRARSTAAIMKELRYNMFLAVNRFKECYLAVVKLKMTGNPTAEQLINAAKAKYNGLNPYDGLNAAVAAKLKCPPLSNWRILKDTDKLSGGATLMALASAAPSTAASPRGRRTTGSEDPLSPGVIGDSDDDDGNGNAPLSSTFTRGQRLFQERPMGNKAAKATSRAEAHLNVDAAANTAALESLAASAAQRTALAFWSTPEASNSSEGRKWWANEVRRRLQEAEDKDKDAQKGRDMDEGDLLVALPSAPHGQGQGTRGRHRRARDEVDYNSEEVEEEAERAASRAGARGFGGDRGARGGRGHGRGRGRGRGGRCERVRTARPVVSFSSLSTPPPPSTRLRRGATNASSTTDDDESTDQALTTGSDGRAASERRSTPMASQVTPSTPVEAAAGEAAEMMAAAPHSADSEEVMADNTDKDYDSEQNGRSRRGRATAHGKRPPFPTRRCRTPAGTIAPEAHATDAEE